MSRKKIQSVSTLIKSRLKNISLRTGDPINKIVKSGLMKVVEQYPDYLKVEKDCKKKHMINIDGIPRKTEKEMKAIAANLNIPYESFLRGCLLNVIKEYPDEVQDYSPFGMDE